MWIFDHIFDVLPAAVLLAFLAIPVTPHYVVVI